ncbi:hypothetical protein, partial [Brucella abortus]|uniref:hypothetical protein n=1 Tax=Brucella abortus TaxID=235 RepID=UPI001AEBBD78
ICRSLALFTTLEKRSLLSSIVPEKLSVRIFQGSAGRKARYRSKIKCLRITWMMPCSGRKGDRSSLYVPLLPGFIKGFCLPLAGFAPETRRKSNLFMCA